MTALLELADDPQPVKVEIPKILAWQVVSALQLACSHPNFKGAIRENVEAFARDLCAALCANNQDLRLLSAMGWERVFDEKVPE